MCVLYCVCDILYKCVLVCVCDILYICPRVLYCSCFKSQDEIICYVPDSAIFMCYDLVFLLMSNPAETEKAELDRRWFISDQVS